MSDIVDKINSVLNEDVGGKLANSINTAINVYVDFKKKEGFEEFTEKNKKKAIELLKKFKKLDVDTVTLGKRGMVKNRKELIADFEKKLK